jgi:hypothetical protein
MELGLSPAQVGQLQQIAFDELAAITSTKRRPLPDELDLDSVEYVGSGFSQIF